MGDIADGLINGDFDEWTGEYLGPGPGYPRSLDPDHPSNQYNKRIYRFAKIKNNELYGLVKYLSRYSKIKGTRGAKTFIKEYAIETGICESEHADLGSISTEIQKHFTKFAKYSKNKLKWKKE